MHGPSKKFPFPFGGMRGIRERAEGAGELFGPVESVALCTAPAIRMGVSLFAPRRSLASDGGPEIEAAEAPARPVRGSAAGGSRSSDGDGLAGAKRAEGPRVRAPRAKVDAGADPQKKESVARGKGDAASKAEAGPRKRLDPGDPVSGAANVAGDAVKGAASGAKAAHSYAREAAALLLLASALYVTLALASFRGDPMRIEVVGADWVGPVGAAFAGVLVQTVGVCAWLVPLDLALFAGPLLQGKPAKVTLVRVSGDLVVLVVVAALLHVAFPASVAFGAMALGGAAGELFGEVMRALFSTLGSYIVGLTVVSLILIGRAAFSIIDWAQRAERRARSLRERGEGGLRAIVGAWDQARELDDRRREEERKAGEPVITEAEDEAIVAALGDDSPVPFPRVKPLLLGAGAASERGPSIGVSGASAPRGPVIGAAASSAERGPVIGASAAVGSLARAARAEAPTPTPVPAGTDKKRGRKKNGADGSPEAASAVAAAPVVGVAIPNADAIVIAQPLPDDASDPIEAAVVEEVAAEPPAELAPETRTSAKQAALAPAEIAPSPRAVAAPEPRAVAAPEPRAVAAPEPRVQVPPAPPAAPPEPRIVDTSAALHAEKPVEIIKVVPAIGEGFRLPSTDMLDAAAGARIAVDEEQLKLTAVQLEKVLADYGVSGKVEEIHPGPTVTTFEVSPAAGTKVSKVASLADDLALGLSRKVRIVAPIPGKNRIGFEVPNERRMPVVMRELVEDKRFLEMKAPLPCVLGRDIIGAPYFADLASMPHVIVAGATGAGKSVGLNVMLVSLLYRRTPAELRLLMIDPKVVELAPFDGIPHMLLPVVTDMKQASNALKWAVDEMERRYQLFANAGTRNITSYNGWVERVRKGEVKPPKKALPRILNAIAPDGTDVEIPPAGDGSDAELPETLPFIVIVVDEFADLMMQQGKEVEASVARLAQKARAAGMHVILATQRPSVDVITGMIKANFPTRIAFRVAQKVDSRTILDEQGAEHLLGRGDMLVKMNGSNDTRRVQCPFCSEEEVQRVTDFLRLQGAPVYDENILKPRDEDGEGEVAADDELDAMYDAAVRVVADTRRCSTSWLQRKLGIGYNRAAKIVEAMEKRGVVGPANGAKDREVLIGTL